ncbi:hypothetical protein BOX15_Mlig009081g3 [Macrostomum lignano]|uniref:Transcription initiation factor TFIID subunit 1 n=1 Tax=Macrostomum lignano TaxID=282301 RepID=A0A267G901_9PLAT|nr:hypothetical protein BOX15_Mlig009081g3 [Macrostomum lignano]
MSDDAYGASNGGNDVEETENKGGFNLAGFMFGNVNESGELEEFPEEEGRRHIRDLAKCQAADKDLIINKEVFATTANTAQALSSATADEAESADSKPTVERQDFYDIDEAAVDDAAMLEAAASLDAAVKGDDEYDDDYDNDKAASDAAGTAAEQVSKDASLMPPPTKIPPERAPALFSLSAAQPQSEKAPQILPVVIPFEEPVIDPKRPLANICPEEYRNTDIRLLFPDFDPEIIPRWSRLFKPSVKRTAYADRVPPNELPRPLSVHPADPELPHVYIDDIDMGELPVDNSQLLPDTVQLQRQLKVPQPPASGLLEQLNEDENISGQGQSAVDAAGAALEASGRDSLLEGVGNRWRFGPAALWYDMLGLPPPDGPVSDLTAFPLPKSASTASSKRNDKKQRNISGNGDATDEDEDDSRDGEKSSPLDEDDIGDSVTATASAPSLNDDLFNMANLIHWEDDIVWDAEVAKEKIQASNRANAGYCGWIPSSASRTLEDFQRQYGGTYPGVEKPNAGPKYEGWRSIFAVDNTELAYTNWEDNIVWDGSKADTLGRPYVLTLDLNDEALVIDPSTYRIASAANENAESDGLLSKQNMQLNQLLASDGAFNLSNDQFYRNSSQLVRTGGGAGPTIGSILQHSTPAMELRPEYFPTNLTPQKLRVWYRPPLRRYQRGPMSAYDTPLPVLNLAKQIERRRQQLESERLALGGGNIFFMRTPADLTATDGDLILAEYSEEYPPLMMQIGMATKIINYYKRSVPVDSDADSNTEADKSSIPQREHGEPVACNDDQSPFLGQLSPGQCLQSIENNLFRAPIYPHKPRLTDFLLIRNRNGYSIRLLGTVYTVGQECPLIEVPAPNSKRANNFLRDFLQVNIYRLFLRSLDEPRRVRVDEVRRLFPPDGVLTELTVRKRLKACADLRRSGGGGGWWVLKDEFRLPDEEELRELLSPEDCCAHYSMAVAEQRLKDAGYSERYLQANDDEDELDEASGGGGGSNADGSNGAPRMEAEVRCAPWNTSRVYLAAAKGRIQLDLSGPADPTGCGEAFSYSKPSRSSGSTAETALSAAKHPTGRVASVTGTDADLRKLNLNAAKELLRRRGVDEDDIKKLTRWEFVDVVRTVGTQKAKQGGEDAEDLARFARSGSSGAPSNNSRPAGDSDRYKDACQRLFELQNRVLASDEADSADDNEAGSSSDSSSSSEDESTGAEKSTTSSKKVLRITRRFRKPDGTGFYTRTELVRQPAVIEIYSRIRSTKSDEFIRQFLGDYGGGGGSGGPARQLTRMASSESLGGGDAADSATGASSKKPTKTKVMTPALTKMKCGACGQLGHMRTNKECPMYIKKGSGAAAGTPSKPSGSSQQLQQQPQLIDELSQQSQQSQQSQHSVTNASQAEDEASLSQVDGTKLKLSAKVLNYVPPIEPPPASVTKKKQSSLKSATASATAKSKKLSKKSSLAAAEAAVSAASVGSTLSDDYLAKPALKRRNRRRVDPQVALTSLLEDVFDKIKAVKNSQDFLNPVSEKEYPHYYQIIKQPMDLLTMKERLQKNLYQTREAFIDDVNLIYKNCVTFNGQHSLLSETAKCMLNVCAEEITVREEKLMRYEKAINPLLDEDDMAGLSYILGQAVQKMVAVEGSRPFQFRVDGKKWPDYYTIITKPMDLATLQDKVNAKTYRNRDEFLSDVQLILDNCIAYNRDSSSLTAIARKIVEAGREALAVNASTLDQLEANISRRRQVQEFGGFLEDDGDTFADSASVASQRAVDDVVTSTQQPSSQAQQNQQQQSESAAGLAEDLQLSDSEDSDTDDSSDDGGGANEKQGSDAANAQDNDNDEDSNPVAAKRPRRESPPRQQPTLAATAAADEASSKEDAAVRFYVGAGSGGDNSDGSPIS